MSSTTSTPVGTTDDLAPVRPDATGAHQEPPGSLGSGLGFGRLLHAELRKTVDTRAGRWLLIVIVAVTALAMGLVMWFSREDGAGFMALLTTAVLPQAVLLPVLGILTAASEWSQRTALITFTQEPRRLRVMVAKTLAAVLLGIVVLAVTFVLAALAHVLSVLVAGGDIDLAVTGALVLNYTVIQVIYILMGVAFGALLLNVPLAIAAFFVLPVVISIVTATVGWLRDRAAWIDPTMAGIPFAESSNASAQEWQQLGVTTLIWIVVPLALGLWRVARREIK